MTMDLLLAYLIVINAATFAVFAVDKRRAQKGAWRIRETTLLGMSLAGGAAGGLLAMYTVRHKVNTRRFKYGLPAMFALQVALLICVKASGIL